MDTRGTITEINEKGGCCVDGDPRKISGSLFL